MITVVKGAKQKASSPTTTGVLGWLGRGRLVPAVDPEAKRAGVLTVLTRQLSDTACVGAKLGARGKGEVISPHLRPPDHRRQRSTAAVRSECGRGTKKGEEEVGCVRRGRQLFATTQANVAGREAVVAGWTLTSGASSLMVMATTPSTSFRDIAARARAAPAQGRAPWNALSGILLSFRLGAAFVPQPARTEMSVPPPPTHFPGATAISQPLAWG